MNTFSMWICPPNIFWGGCGNIFPIAPVAVAPDTRKWEERWSERERESVHPSRTWLLLGEALISLKAFISLDLFIPHSLKQPVHPPELGRIFVHLILILVNSYFIKMTPSRRRALTVKWWTLHDRLIQGVKGEIDCSERVVRWSKLIKLSNTAYKSGRGTRCPQRRTSGLG